MNNQTTTLEISTKSIVKVITALTIVAFVIFVKDVLIMLLVAIILASVFSPAVDFLEKYKLPRAIGTIILYTLVFGVLATVVYMIIPPLSEQVKDLGKNLPFLLDKWNGFLQTFGNESGLTSVGNLSEILKSQADKLSAISKSVVDFTFSALGGVFQAFAIIILAFYMIVERNALTELIQTLFTPTQEKKILNILSNVQKSVNAWIKGQLVLSFIVGLLVYLGLTILKVDYALILAVIAGLFEIIPVVGPILAAVFAVIIAFGGENTAYAAFLVVLLYVAIQQLENHVLVPKIMGKAVGLNPVIIILAVLIGVKLLGFLGAILAIPLAAAVAAVIKELRTQSA